MGAQSTRVDDEVVGEEMQRLIDSGRLDVTRFAGQPDRATPLTTEDLEGLNPSWVSTQAELNQAAAENILRGCLWASRARRPPFWYLLDTGLKDLHQAM